MIRGTTHLCIGQEAVSVGMAAVVDVPRGDTVTCTYRGHGHALALGMTLRSMKDAAMTMTVVGVFDASQRMPGTSFNSGGETATFRGCCHLVTATP